ncbi:MAG: 5'-3' exonuclease H3TH domain-containing protein, partial [Aggregatilineales bacterium]
MSDRPAFYVVDGHALAYRQFFGLPLRNFSTSAGEPTNAVYGFTRSIMDIIQKARPQYLAVSFDMGLSGRDALLQAYKGTRAKMPAELVSQLDRINQVVQAFNIPVLALEGYEADDVIGTAAAQAEAAGVATHIITGDRDLLQLLTPYVTAQLPVRNAPDVFYDEQRFREEYGVEPRQLVELKGLMGDSSDNIPGVKGIGEKRARQLIAAYGTLENLYEHLDEISGSLREKLEAGREIAFLSRALATIRRDVPITLDLRACLAHDFDRAAVEDLFRELEFNSLRRRLREEQIAAPANDVPNPESSYPPLVPPDIETVIVRDSATLERLVSVLNSAQHVVWDVETTGTDQMSCDLVGIALAVDGCTGYYVPLGHRAQETLFTGTLAPDQLALDQVIAALRAPLTNTAVAKIAHNAAFDLVVLRRYGLDVTPIAFDTMLAEYVRDPVSKFLGLKSFAANVLQPPVDMTE